MPRTPDEYRELVAFLYETKAAAEEGLPGGCTGFVVAWPGDGRSLATHFYVVTTAHSLREGLTIRLSTVDGGDPKGVRLEIIETTVNEWIPHPSGYDVAAYHLTDRFAGARVLYALSSARILPLSFFAVHNIGPGHDVYLFARVIGLESPEANLAILHSGTISSPPLERWPGKFEQPCFIVETHSRLGYSGAPVFAYVSSEDEGLTRGPIGVPGIQPQLFFVGMFSHYDQRLEPVYDSKDPKTRKELPGHWVLGPTSLGMVVPAWEVGNLLTGTAAVEKRAEVEQQWSEESDTSVPETEATPAFAPSEPSEASTADLMEKLLQVPKEEADEVHRSHGSED